VPKISPTLRRADDRDLAEVLRLYAHLNSSDPALEAGVAERIWSAIRAQECVQLIVAEADGALVSSCMLVTVPNLTRGGRPIGFIENVVTDPGYRRRGIGTRVLRFALDAAWKADCYKVMLATGHKDEATLSFYEGAGFSKGSKIHFEARRPV
jgi:GNAT superfamily N-acetyltransferase